jgi:hypothetical protein
VCDAAAFSVRPPHDHAPWVNHLPQRKCRRQLPTCTSGGRKAPVVTGSSCRFADHALQYIQRIQKAMLRANEPSSLYTVHGHYADAGEAAALIAHTLGVPMVLTGHSLGRNKLDHLKRQGAMTAEAIEETYKISRRIEGEERSLDAALMVITSTQQEVDLQWGLYDGYRETVAKVLRLRNIQGHAMPVMHVIPPGLDFSSLKVRCVCCQPALWIVTRSAALRVFGCLNVLAKCLKRRKNDKHYCEDLQHVGNPVSGKSAKGKVLLYATLWCDCPRIATLGPAR